MSGVLYQFPADPHPRFRQGIRLAGVYAAATGAVLQHREALLLHGFIWWAWHIQALVRIGMHLEGVGANIWLSIIGTMLISLVPAMMNAILFVYVWAATQSLAVASVYHSTYDEVRDALERSVGFDSLVSVWEMAVTTHFGVILLWKGDWKSLYPHAENE